MNKELIDQRRKLLFPDDVWFLLLKCVPREQVVSCVQSLGIVFNGIRPNKVSHDEMANALSEEFFTNYEAAQHITTLIDSQAPCDNHVIPQTPDQTKKLNKNLKSMQPPDVIRIAWACSAMQTAASTQCVDVIHSFLEKTCKKADKMLKKEMIDDLMTLPGEVSSLETSLQTAEQKIHKQEKYIYELEKKNQSFAAKLQHAEESIFKYGKTIKNLENELVQSHNKLSKLNTLELMTKQLESANDKIKSLEEELHQATAKVSSWKNLKRVGLFIDVQNIIISAREIYNKPLNFKSVLDKISGKGIDAHHRLITESTAYLAEDPGKEKINLKNRLQQLSIAVKTRPIIYRSDGTAKGDWDLGMTIEIMEHADRLDIVTIATGDGDFLDLVEHLKKTKPFLNVEVACFQSTIHTSEQLIKAADYVHYLGSQDMLT